MKAKTLTLVLLCFTTMGIASVSGGLSVEHGIDMRSQILFVDKQDSLALVALYNSTNGTDWVNNTNWLSNRSVHEWYGVRVDSGRVTFLELIDNYLTGTLPPEIGNLTKLDTLHLYNNSLTGEIPKEISKLTSLKFLRLRLNELTGSLPDEIANLKNLETLSVSSNFLSGDFPVQVLSLTKLTHLWLQWNQFTGTIPPEIGNLTNLEALSLHSNNFTGSYPKEIGNLTNLRFLYLGNIPLEKYTANNRCTGSIPPEFGNLVNLERFWLKKEKLITGPIPKEFVNLTNLGDLYISNNKFEDLPDLSSLTFLRRLLIDNNKFTFEDIEPNIGVPRWEFIYWPQDSVGVEQDTTIDEGSSLTILVTVGGAHNIYQWKKDGIRINGATDSSYTINSVNSTDADNYTCEITNTLATRLTLYSRPTNVNVLPVGIDDEPSVALPEQFVLYQNYPNPFNPVTTIQYGLPKSANVTLKIYDMLGREVATLADEHQGVGYHWKNWDATDHSSGIYFYQIQADDFQKIRKMILRK